MMKIIVFFIALILGLSAHSAPIIKDNLGSGDSLTNGLQFSLSKSFLKLKSNVESYSISGVDGSSISELKPNDPDDESFNDVMGISVGYVYAPFKSLGYMATIQFEQIKEDGESFEFYSLYGDAVYSLNSKIITFAGLNISKVKEFDDYVTIKPNLGAQVGAEYKITKNFSIRGRYILRNNTLVFSESFQSFTFDAELDAQISGLEFSLIGTF